MGKALVGVAQVALVRAENGAARPPVVVVAAHVVAFLEAVDRVVDGRLEVCLLRVDHQPHALLRRPRRQL